MGLPADLSQVSWAQVFVRQCPLIRDGSFRDRKSGRLVDLVFWEKLNGGGSPVRILLVSSRMPAALPQLLLIIGNLVVRYSAGDSHLLFSSIGGGLGPPRPSTF